jgi:hypothetical protein
MAGSAAYAGILQGIGPPEEWGQGYFAGNLGAEFLPDLKRKILRRKQ